MAENNFAKKKHAKKGKNRKKTCQKRHEVIFISRIPPW